MRPDAVAESSGKNVGWLWHCKHDNMLSAQYND